jgi:hypothetical protein
MPTRVTMIDQIDATFVPTVRPEVADVEIDGEAVLYDEAHAAVHVLNDTAALVWACCDGSGTVGDIAADIAAAFRMQEASVLADVLDVIRRFAGEGLLQGITPTTA